MAYEFDKEFIPKDYERLTAKDFISITPLGFWEKKFKEAKESSLTNKTLAGGYSTTNLLDSAHNSGCQHNFKQWPGNYNKNYCIKCGEWETK